MTRLSDSLPQLDTLSMGMSGDLEAAVSEGANIVRVGTDILGRGIIKLVCDGYPPSHVI